MCALSLDIEWFVQFPEDPATADMNHGQYQRLIRAKITIIGCPLQTIGLRTETVVC